MLVTTLVVILISPRTRERAHAPPASLDAGAGTAPVGEDVRSADAEPDAGVAESLPPVRLSEPSIERSRSAAGVLSGRVLAFASGAPISGAELSFEHEGATTSVRTNARGEFTFSPRVEGTYVLALASAEGFLPFAPEWGHSPIRWRARPSVRLADVVIYLVDAIVYVATIVDASGAPVEGAEVHVFGAERGERTLAPLASRHVSDARGEVRFLAPDDAVLEARHVEHGRGRARVDHAVQASRSVTIRLDRERTGAALAIAGRVIGPNEEPIGGALLIARHAERFEDPPHPTLETTSDEAGRFTFSDADEGSYRIVARADGYARVAQEEVAAGARNVVLRLGPDGGLRIRARDTASGAPVAALSAVVSRASGPIAEEVLAIESGYDAQGELEVRGLPPGLCSVVVIAPGYAPSPAMSALVREGASTDIIVILGRGGTIEGRVVSADGRGLERARVTLEGRIGSGSSAVPLEANALSEADGRFSLTGVREGRHSIVVWAADHHGRVRSGIDVQPGASTDLGTIDLAPVEEGERPSLELAGIGAVLAAEGDAMVVGRVIEGGGAAEVGVIAGDAILEVDGTRVVELGFQGTIERIRGPEGTSVVLSVRRANGRVEPIVVPRRRVRA